MAYEVSVLNGRRRNPLAGLNLLQLGTNHLRFRHRDSGRNPLAGLNLLQQEMYLFIPLGSEEHVAIPLRG